MENSSSAKPYSLQNMVTLILDNFAIIFLFALFFIGGFFSGSIYTENQSLKNGKPATVATDTTGAAAAAGAAAAPTLAQLTSVPKLSKDDHYRGNLDAKVQLIEYSDFECPYCAQFYPQLVKLAEEYGDKIVWTHRQYPLPFHPHAEKAAEASECIKEQGGNDAFWKYADKIFELNNSMGGQISDDAIKTAATGSGVNMDTYQKCLDSGKFADAIKTSESQGQAAGINGTPGTIVISSDGSKGELIPGSVDYATLKATVDKYLN